MEISINRLRNLGKPFLQRYAEICIWSIEFFATPQVFLHNEGYFIFRFISEEEKVTLLQNGPYTFNNRPLVLKQWEPNFQMSKEPLQVIPVWVRFPKLPIKYWTPRSLGRIASCLGKPVCTYKLIAKGDRVSYAHILIEMDVSMELQEEIPIELRGGKCKLHTIEYEWKPLYCQTCLNIEHHNGDCKKTMQTDKVKQQMNRKKQKMDWRVKTGARPQGTTKPTDPVTSTGKQAKPALPKEIG